MYEWLDLSSTKSLWTVKRMILLSKFRTVERERKWEKKTYTKQNRNASRNQHRHDQRTVFQWFYILAGLERPVHGWYVIGRFRIQLSLYKFVIFSQLRLCVCVRVVSLMCESRIGSVVVRFLSETVSSGTIWRKISSTGKKKVTIWKITIVVRSTCVLISVFLFSFFSIRWILFALDLCNHSIFMLVLLRQISTRMCVHTYKCRFKNPLTHSFTAHFMPSSLHGFAHFGM